MQQCKIDGIEYIDGEFLSMSNTVYRLFFGKSNTIILENIETKNKQILNWTTKSILKNMKKIDDVTAFKIVLSKCSEIPIKYFKIS